MAYSRSTSPPDRPPLVLARIANEEQRNRIYRDRASFFKGGLSEDLYVRKIRLLDTCASLIRSSLITADPFACHNKTVWTLSTEDKVNDDYLASMEVIVRDLFFRASPESDTVVRKAAYIAGLFVPLQHRGHGYARELMHRVVALLRSRHYPAPLDNIALVYAACSADAEDTCALKSSRI